MKRHAAIGFPAVGLTTDELMLRVLRRVELKPASLGNVDQLWQRREGALREALFEAHRVVDVTIAGEPMTVATTFPHIAVVTRSQSIAPGLELFQSRLRGIVGDVGTEPSDIRVRPFTSPLLGGGAGYAYFGAGVFVPAGELRTGRVVVERPDKSQRCEIALGDPGQPAGFFQGQTGLAFTIASNPAIAPAYPPKPIFDTSSGQELDKVLFFLGKLRDDQPLTLERLAAANADKLLSASKLEYTENQVSIASTVPNRTELRNSAVLDTWLTLTATTRPNAPAARIRFETSLNNRPFRPQIHGAPRGLRLAVVGFCLPRAKALTYTARWWLDFDSDGQPVYSDLLPRRYRLFATAWKGIFWAPYERRDDPRPFIEGVPFGPTGNDFNLRWMARPHDGFLLERQHRDPFGWIELPDDAPGNNIEITISPTENPRAVSLHWLDTFGMVEDAMGIVDGLGKQYADDFPVTLSITGDEIVVNPARNSDEARARPFADGDRRQSPGPSAARPPGRNPAGQTSAMFGRRTDATAHPHKIGEVFRLGPVMVRIERD